MSESDLGGYREIVASVTGEGVFGRLRFESGVHRVQRVPETESGGRTHTSAATVAVLPEVEHVDIEIRDADIRIDTFRSSGAGGQHVNKTDSAVRITHLPTNTVVSSQNDRSQHRNRAEAMAMLKAKLYELELRKRNEKKQALEDTKTDIGWGHQIRSYVLDQSRIKDLRTNHEVGNTQAVLDGDLEDFIAASLKQGV
jgi:peptide chain release factor 2